MNTEKTLTAERLAELHKNIDLSDIPEITDFSGFKPRYPEYFKPKREGDLIYNDWELPCMVT